MNARVVATAKDGGSQIIEYRHKVYFLDYGIDSKTRGKLFHGTTRDGEPVEEKLSLKIKSELKP